MHLQLSKGYDEPAIRCESPMPGQAGQPFGQRPFEMLQFCLDLFALKRTLNKICTCIQCLPAPTEEL